MVRARLQLACLLGWIVLFGAPPGAWADGSDVEGYGFVFRLPSGFKPAGSSDEEEGSERSYRRRVDAGEMRITVASSTQSSGAEADLEMELGARLDGLELALDAPDGASTTESVQVAGASQAHQVVFQSETRSERRVTARRGTLLVTASLSCPPDADLEASVIWASLLGSLRLEEPGGGLVRVLPYLVGLIALIGIGLRVVRGASKPPAATDSAADGFVPHVASDAVRGASSPYEPASMPSHAPPVARETLGGFSRAADGMPIFDASAKARGVTEDAFKLPEVTPRRAAPTPQPPPAEPKKAPTLRPPTPMVRL